MTPVEVAESYDQIAQRWAGDAFPAGNGIAQHERALAFLQHKRRALDAGCGGNGRIVELLWRHGFEVEGVDLSARMIDMARARHPHVVFHRADLCEWALPGRYDFISAWDSLWHVPLSRHAGVLRKLLAGLEPGGVCIFTAGGRDAPEEKTDAAMGVPMYYSVLGIPATLALLAEAGCACRHLEYDQHPELHVYIVAQKIR